MRLDSYQKKERPKFSCHRNFFLIDCCFWGSINPKIAKYQIGLRFMENLKFNVITKFYDASTKEQNKIFKISSVNGTLCNITEILYIIC
ncbi:hypothetical protein BpHYR1_025778 [Brachionus plicatilis]|uniref:Uncharacterized protein n=1 Tax=Brachionus plicatilis TaxID=10195 RepID=A0A3M7PGS3_BRAPC|nr:hypothetical protein BpHYR1_025778 [Brachionus plicatilis]